MLDNEHARAEVRPRPDARQKPARSARVVSVVPAGLPAWLCSDAGGSFDVALLTIAVNRVRGPLRARLDSELFTEPRLNFFDAHLWHLGSQLALECSQPDDFSDLARDSLVSLMLLRLFRRNESSAAPRVAQLSTAQLHRVSEHIQSNVDQRISLAQLAAVAGISQSHFSRAFKATTGLPPHRWQLEARIREAQGLLAHERRSLSDVALATGFADQSHFTRVFRNIVGETPGNWRRRRSKR